MNNVVALKERTRDEVFEALVEVCGMELHELTRSARGVLNKVAMELKEVGADPDAIKKRAAMYRVKYENAALTPSALAKHWPMLVPAKEDRWTQACRLAREKGLDPFKGVPYETQAQFYQRVGM